MERPGPKAVRAALRRHARPDKAEGMRAYLKSEMPCLGVQVPVARRLAKTLFGATPCEALPSLAKLVEQLWFAAEFREERFVALNVLRLRAHRALLTAKAAPLLEKLIRSGAWWDLVDELSAHVVGVMLENDPKAMTKVLRRWAESDELWLKRSVLVCQVVRGDATDLDVLEHAIEHAVDGEDFFLRKGIGWAMRSVGRKNPAVVRQWLTKWEGRLSPLSVREARKALG
ncbi:MAG: DNA alkylation repair protein [Archangium sp.]|nr:DNA alkylation repair protein [Archangium sp.]